MHRPGADPDNIAAEDFLCDFCHAHWSEDRPMVEGHRGSLLCGSCLTVAYTQVILDHGGGKVPEHVNCTVCLLHRDVEYWSGKPRERPADDPAVVCRSCIEQSVRTFERDPASGWKRPG